jgi:hypothetical protein
MFRTFEIALCLTVSINESIMGVEKVLWSLYVHE